MVGIKRGGAKLLHTVNNKPHATSDDHHDFLPTPPTTNSATSSKSKAKSMNDEEDINRDPDSTDDDLPATTLPPTSGFRVPQKQAVKPASPKAAFKHPSINSHATASSKRSSPDDSHNSDEDAMLFSQSSQPKRKKGSNIHANYVPGSKLKTALYGKTKAKARSQEKKARPMTASQETKHSVQNAGATFKAARGADLVGQDTPPAAGPVFQSRAIGQNISSSPISLLDSPPSSPEVEEVRPTDSSKVECDICGGIVELVLRQDFEDQFNGGKKLNYKWRDRFCRHHKQHEAKEIWADRGYPNIHWEGFSQRLRSPRHSKHLKKVLSGEINSVYRDELETNLKGRSKTLMQNLKAGNDKKHGKAGYYGPRGEKLMAEHILTHFASQLRETASRDRVVAAAGVSGGVSGFVQAVLVPELAVSLVMEDLSTDSHDVAMKVIAESAELGDLLNPENEDRIKEVEDLDD